MKKRAITITVLIVILMLLGFVYIAIVNLRRMANQQAAHEAVKQIVSAEKKYKERLGKYGTLKELGDSNLIIRDLGEGKYKGFRYQVVVRKESFTISAIPLNLPANSYLGTGFRALCVNEKGPCNQEEEREALTLE